MHRERKFGLITIFVFSLVTLIAMILFIAINSSIEEHATAEVSSYEHYLPTADESYKVSSSCIGPDSEVNQINELTLVALSTHLPEEDPISEVSDEEVVSATNNSIEDSSAEETTIEVEENILIEENAEDSIDETPYFCTTRALNVRSGPGTENEIVGAIYAGDEIRLFSNQNDEWVKILYDEEKTGYINSKYISNSEEDIPTISSSSLGTYTDDDVYLLAQILYCEAGGVGKEEMGRVGQVVINRMTTDYREFRKNNSIYDVVTQSGQYPQTWKRIKGGVKPSQDALDVARGLLDGSFIPDFGDAQNYITEILWQTGFKPKWSCTVVYTSSCGHYYSKLK